MELNGEEIHCFHKIVANQIDRYLEKIGISLQSRERSPECGGEHRIPLYVQSKGQKPIEYCNADYIVTLDNEVKVVVEIEESDFKPIYLLGKAFVTGYSEIHIARNLGKNERVSKELVLLQIIIDETSENNEKRRQWDSVSSKLKEVTEKKHLGNISKYELIHENPPYFLTDEFLEYLGTVLGKSLIS